ncbi:hypothetical protein [Spirillospora albida]|uniref:hypothetical protein n=1 Tax=Spirillospora albida TaxID=58123 RepID=UPI0004BED14A|nr:hypothetical protein [Spirillospora albida]
MIALVRFLVAGYLWSARVLQPLIVIALIVVVVLLQGPGGPDAAEPAVGTLGDVAAFMFPVWAWAARGLLDTQPDEQRALSATAVGRRWVAVGAGLLAAYGVNLALGMIALLVPLLQAVLAGVPVTAVLTGCGLSALVAAAGTLLGAWTSRAIIPNPGLSLPALLGGAVAVLLLGIGRLAWLSVPMIAWLRSAHGGPGAFVDGFPGVALHLVLWSAVVGGAYVAAARVRV